MKQRFHPGNQIFDELKFQRKRGTKKKIDGEVRIINIR